MYVACTQTVLFVVKALVIMAALARCVTMLLMDSSWGTKKKHRVPPVIELVLVPVQQTSSHVYVL